MDYEQKYKNLIERLMKAKEDYDIADERYCCVIDGLIPEPQESEDERIRMEIISYIKSSGAVTNPNWIAWLEKQKTSERSEDDNAKIEFLCNLIKRNISEGTYSFGDGAKNGFVSKQEAIKMLQSLKPQSRWKPTKQQMEAIKQAAEQNRASEMGNILDNLFVELKNM